MVGSGDEAKWKVYFVDFGASTKYRLYTGKHMETGTGPVGTALYMSIHAHRNEPPARRDDLGSLGYMLIYMSCEPAADDSRLPWETCKTEEETIQLKESTTTTELLESVKDPELKQALLEYMTLVDQIDLQEDPEYEKLINLFLKLLQGKSTPIKQVNEKALMQVAQRVGLTWSSLPSGNKHKVTKSSVAKKPRKSSSRSSAAKEKKVAVNTTTSEPIIVVTAEEVSRPKSKARSSKVEAPAASSSKQRRATASVPKARKRKSKQSTAENNEAKPV